MPCVTRVGVFHEWCTVSHNQDNFLLQFYLHFIVFFNYSKYFVTTVTSA